MAYFGNGGVACFNVLAAAWLCSYCCAPPVSPVILIPATASASSLSNATVSTGAVAETTVRNLPLLAVPVRSEHVDR